MTNFRIMFKNTTNADVTIGVSINNNGISNFRLAQGAEDHQTLASPGDTVYFWWRNDGFAVNVCFSSDATCGLNTISMPAMDIEIDLSDPSWLRQTN